MSDHPNAARARELFDAFDSGDMQAMDAALDDDVIWHEIGNPNPVVGKAPWLPATPGARRRTGRSPASSTT